MPDDRMVCKQCYRPVNKLYQADYEGQPREQWVLQGWVHVDRPVDREHEVEPIPAADADFVDQVCDFCGEPNIAWIFPTSPDKIRSIGNVAFYDETAWAACPPCHDAVLAATSGLNLAKRIAPRSLPLKRTQPNMRPFLLHAMGAQYQHFLDSRSGPPITYNEYVS